MGSESSLGQKASAESPLLLQECTGAVPPGATVPWESLEVQIQLYSRCGLEAVEHIMCVRISISIFWRYVTLDYKISRGL